MKVQLWKFIYKIKLKKIKIKNKIKYIANECNLIKVIKFIFEVANVLAAITTIIIFISFGSLEKFQRTQPIMESISINAWKNSLSNVKLNYNKKYIEDEIGIPMISDKFEFSENNYEKTIYSNNFFTLVCIYNDDELTGYFVIGNNKKFNFKNYRAEFSLFDNTINEVETKCQEKGIESILAMGCSVGDRFDNSKFFYECNLQHGIGATKPVLIGYGITDVGYIMNLNEFYDYIRDVPPYNGSYLNDKDNKLMNRVDYYFKTKECEIRNYPVNFFFVFEDNDVNMELIQKELVNYSMVLSKDEYANLQDDYMKKINEFRKFQGKHNSKL